MKTTLLRFLTLALALACVALVGTIEVLSYQAGDGIGRKAQYEPHSKWRLSSLSSEKRVTEKDFRLEKDIPQEQALTPDQAQEVEHRAQTKWLKALPHHRLACVMRNYSAWGLPIGLMTLGLGVVCWPGQKSFLRVACCSVGALTAILATVRYISSLGW